MFGVEGIEESRDRPNSKRVIRTVYYLLCTDQGYAAYNVQCTVYTVHCKLFRSVQFTVYTVHCTVYRVVHCTSM